MYKRKIVLQYAAGAKDFSTLRSVQTDFGVDPASHSTDTRTLTPVVKGPEH